VSFGLGKVQAWSNVIMDIEYQVFLDVTPYNIAGKYSYLAETYFPYLESPLLYPEAEGSRFLHKTGNYLSP
jgi:hypothetical protein